MTKVLLFLGSFGRGGVQSFVINHLDHMNRSGMQFDVYVLQGDHSPYEETIKSYGGNVFYGHDTYSPLKTFALMKKWRAFFEGGKYDVVHVHLNMVNAWVLLAAKRAGIPVRLSHCHSTDLLGGGFVQRIYSYLRRYIINQTATTCLACGQEAGIALYGQKHSFTVINNGIDLKKFLSPSKESILSLTNDYSIPANCKIYANITRIGYQKNQPFVVEIFSEIHKVEPDSILLLGGPLVVKSAEDCTIWEEAKAKITSYGLQEKVILFPSIKDMPSLYSLVDVWLLPSRWEGLPIVAIELQAESVPIIASDVVTRECDLGLGLMTFVSLNESPQKWAEIAVSKMKIMIPEEIIKNVFAKRGFDVFKSSKRLETFYRQLY